MAPTFRYSHPTTPAGTGFDTDLGSVVPWGSITGLVTMAKVGEVGQSSIYIDDPEGSLDIKGLHRFRMVESEASSDPCWNGYIGHQTIGRIGANERFLTGDARSWELALEDDNAILGFRVVWDTDGNRPAETGSARLAWLISTNYLGDAVDDGYVTYPSGTALMDATDYRGQFGKDVLADIALQKGGVNFFAQYNLSTSGTSQSIGLWFGDSNTSTAFTSSIVIDNYPGASDGTAIFAPSDDTVLIRDPSRIAAGVYLPYNGGSLYAYDYDTSYEFAFRDQVAPTATITSQAQATALADQFLAAFDEQDERITTTIWMKPANLYDVRAGQRLQARFQHLPGYGVVKWVRVTQKTIGNFNTSLGRYEVGLELSPQLEQPGFWGYAQLHVQGEPLSLEFDEGIPPDDVLFVAWIASREPTSTPPWTEANTGLAEDDGVGGFTIINSASLIGSATVTTSGISWYPGAMFTVVSSGATDNLWVWKDGGGGTTRPSGFCLGMRGYATTPDDIWQASAQSATGSYTISTGDMTCTVPGIFIVGFNADGYYPENTTFTAQSPAVELGHLEAEGAYPPTPACWFGYLVVDAAGTYSVSVDTNSDGPFGFVAAFFPEA